MTSDLTRESPVAFFAAHLSARAERYFPELAGTSVKVRLLQLEVRPASLLYRFELKNGGGCHGVMVKAPLGPGEPTPQPLGEEPPHRPRLAITLRPSERAQCEYRSLAMIYDHFSGRGDPRFGAVRALDVLPEHGAFVMQIMQGTSLRRLLYQTHRGCGPAVVARLEAAFRDAGGWLRAYHAIVPPEHVEPRHVRRRDYIQFVAQVAEFLGSRLGDPFFFRRVIGTLDAAATTTLPEELPLGLGHGDFALRNVLVGNGGRITVLDTLARYRTSIYEDIGYFLVSLRHNWPQVFSMGTAFSAERLATCERAFLSGYFAEEPVPYAAIRLYELQAMLDMWSEVASRQERSHGWRARAKRSIRVAFMSHNLRSRIAEEINGTRREPDVSRVHTPSRRPQKTWG